MDLRRLINYQWRLLISLFTLLCMIIVACWLFQHNHEWIMQHNRTMWAGIISLSVIILLYVYIISKRIKDSIASLRDFANRAVNGESIIDTSSFPSDELGDISRQIVKLYNARSLARQQSERERQIAIHATAENNRIKRTLTNNINHEIKTPVGIIKGYIDTIIDNPDMDDGTRSHFMLKAQGHILRLCNLLNDISAITRLDELDKVPTAEINFHDLIYSISNEIKDTSISGAMAFVYDIPLNCRIKGNESLLNAAILNLIRNAVAYSHGSEMGIKLIDENDEMFTFIFYDNGIGVEPQHIPYIFDRFYRIDHGQSRRAYGTGLGLPIVKSTIIALGGTISVQKHNPTGLQFTFTLKKIGQ